MLCSKCQRHKHVARVANSRTRYRRDIVVCARCAKQLGVDFKSIGLFMDDDEFMRIRTAKVKRRKEWQA